jgi:hypothetical protein
MVSILDSPYVPGSTVGQLSMLVGGGLEFHELMNIIVSREAALHEYLLAEVAREPDTQGALTADHVRYVEVLTCAALVFPGQLSPSIAQIFYRLMPVLDTYVDESARSCGDCMVRLCASHTHNSH